MYHIGIVIRFTFSYLYFDELALAKFLVEMPVVVEYAEFLSKQTSASTKGVLCKNPIFQESAVLSRERKVTVCDMTEWIEEFY